MDRDFLGIKNENWMAASRDLGAHALRLYLYFAANADGYSFALSPAAIQEAIGMPRTTYHDQFRILVSKGYLVQTGGNTFAFYETPQSRVVQHSLSSMSEAVHDVNECPSSVFLHTDDAQNCTPTTTEINNIKILTDRLGINIGDAAEQINTNSALAVQPEWEREEFPPSSDFKF